MAGTLTISTLSDGTNSTSATNCISGSAKAWVNFNGTTSPGTIRASYNVSSVTKNGTGDYTVNFTNALSDANYVVNALARTSGNTVTLAQYKNGGSQTTTTFSVATYTLTPTSVDATEVYLSVFR